MIQVLRSRVQLVPQYAFTEMFMPHASEEAIYFTDVDGRGPPKYPGSIFSFSDVKGMMTLLPIASLIPDSRLIDFG
jgi:hypothetical protein